MAAAATVLLVAAPGFAQETSTPTPPKPGPPWTYWLGWAALAVAVLAVVSAVAGYLIQSRGFDRTESGRR